MKHEKTTPTNTDHATHGRIVLEHRHEIVADANLPHRLRIHDVPTLCRRVRNSSREEKKIVENRLMNQPVLIRIRRGLRHSRDSDPGRCIRDHDLTVRALESLSSHGLIGRDVNLEVRPDHGERSKQQRSRGQEEKIFVGRRGDHGRCAPDTDPNLHSRRGTREMRSASTCHDDGLLSGECSIDEDRPRSAPPGEVPEG